MEAWARLRDVLIHGGLAVATAMLEEEVVRLCGPRYSRGEGLGSRWGHGPGEAVLGGRRVVLERPRVRQDGQEVPLATYQQFQSEDPLTERAMEQMLVGVSTRKYARSLEPLVPGLSDPLCRHPKLAASENFNRRRDIPPRSGDGQNEPHEGPTLEVCRTCGSQNRA